MDLKIHEGIAVTRTVLIATKKREADFDGILWIAIGAFAYGRIDVEAVP